MKTKSILRFGGMKEMLSKEQMKNLTGGAANPNLLKENALEASNVCYECCTPDFSLCGGCDTRGNGGCQGNGVAVFYCCMGQS